MARDDRLWPQLHISGVKSLIFSVSTHAAGKPEKRLTHFKDSLEDAKRQARIEGNEMKMPIKSGSLTAKSI